MLSHNQIVRLTFGLKLRELRQERSLTPGELARACDVSLSYLNEIEKGKKYPKADKILQLSKVLGVSYDQLTSLTLSRRLEPVAVLLHSGLLGEFPLETMFGLDPVRVVELIADAPAKMSAFLSTLFEIARNYEMRREHFFLAALRAYQEMHSNYFEELEQDVRAFSGQHKLRPAVPFERAQLEEILVKTYTYTLDREVLGQQPALAELGGRLRSVFQPRARRLLLRPGLSGAQEGFVLAREIAFNYLSLKERPLTTTEFPVRSFAEVLHNFQASYFAGALLMDEDRLVRDLQALFSLRKWDPARLLALLVKYDVSPEMFMQRLTTLLPRHFGLQSLFFLRFDQATATAPYELTKELHLARLHKPHGNELHEHYCRRWVSLRLPAGLRAALPPALNDVGLPPAGDLGSISTVTEAVPFSLTQPPAGTQIGLSIEPSGAGPAGGRLAAGGQVSRYFGTDDEYLCFTLARAGAAGAPAVSVTVGLRCDEALRGQVKFLNDPALLRLEVNETCERCAIRDCAVRAAPPTVLEAQVRQQARDAAIAALVDG